MPLNILDSWSTPLQELPQEQIGHSWALLHSEWRFGCLHHSNHHMDPHPAENRPHYRAGCCTHDEIFKVENIKS